MKRVLVLGGYGGFGGRLARLLARDGFEVVVAGRSVERARAFCAAHADSTLIPLAADRADPAAAVAQARPWLVVDAAGPFQASDYRVAKACIVGGCHYLDLADARAFVCGFAALDAPARAAGVSAISGASSVPALTSAVADRLAQGLDRVTAIDVALSASNRASGGVSVTRAILSYVGRPIALWRGQEWRRGFGWQELAKLRFAVPGRPALRRRVALCDVPDLELLPGRYAGRPAVRFRAGTELEFQNLILWLLSWPVRWGLASGLGALTRPGVAVQRLFRRLGGDRSAMAVELAGWRGETAVRRRWTVLAERGDGPWIPAMAAALLARRLRQGLPPGARAAAGEVSLEEFETAFAPFAIETAVEEENPAPLYARIMGERFEALPAAVRAAHLVCGELRLDGEARIERGRGLLARVAARLARLPPAGEAVPVSVWMEERGGGETWRRDFGGHGFATRLRPSGDRLVERFGPLGFRMRLRSEPDGLSMPLERVRLGPLPLPLWLAPRTRAKEFEAGGRFRFDVAIDLPVLGPLIRYSGWLEPVVAAGPDGARSEAGSGSLG